MNNVAGAIHAAGSRQLKEFTWGEIVVNIINSLLDDLHPPVTVESTGKSIIQILDTLSDKEKNMVLSYPISLVDENGEFILEINKGNKDPVATLIISFSLIMIILSFLVTYLQASDAFFDQSKSPIELETVIEILKQFL